MQRIVIMSANQGRRKSLVGGMGVEIPAGEGLDIKDGSGSGRRIGSKEAHTQHAQSAADVGRDLVHHAPRLGRAPNGARGNGTWGYRLHKGLQSKWGLTRAVKRSYEWRNGARTMASRHASGDAS
jgi:hypothetical protein